MIYSSSLKELYYKEKFDLIKKFFKDEEYIIIIKTINNDYIFARQIESLTYFKISFYDYLHIAISKRIGVPLITRDKELIKIAKEYTKVSKPEDLIG
jgi:predicted nucleic acid-binding protein